MLLIDDFHFNAIVFSLVFASWKKKKKKSVKVPQQTNDEECGRFVLYFSKLFVEGAPEDFRIEDYPYFVSFHLLSCLLSEAPEHIYLVMEQIPFCNMLQMNENWFNPNGLESFCEKLGIGKLRFC
jgi:hypothetical protein